MIVLDVKPWDDTTDMAQLEKEVRSVVKDGLLWGSCTLLPCSVVSNILNMPDFAKTSAHHQT